MKNSSITFICMSLRPLLPKYPVTIALYHGKFVQPMRALSEAIVPRPGVHLLEERGSFFFTHNFLSAHKPKGIHPVRRKRWSFCRSVLVSFLFMCQERTLCSNPSKGTYRPAEASISFFCLFKSYMSFESQ